MSGNDAQNADDNMLSPSQREFQKVMSENLNGTDVMGNKIISYKQKAPAAPEGEFKKYR